MVLLCGMGDTHEKHLKDAKVAVEMEPEFGWLFKLCCAPCSVQRPSCRSLRIALENMRKAKNYKDMCEKAKNRGIIKAVESAHAADAALLKVRSHLAELLTDLEADRGINRDVKDRYRQKLNSLHECVDRTMQSLDDKFEHAFMILNHGVGPYPDCRVAVEYLWRVVKADRFVRESRARAMCELGWCLIRGRGTTINKVNALELFRNAQQLGNIEAAGHLSLHNRDFARDAGNAAAITEAIKEWERRANMPNNHADAQYFLGKTMDPKSPEALQWFTKSAHQSCAAAQVRLGWIYETGQGVDQCAELAVDWYRKAAMLGDAQGQCNLGACYENGNGVPKDPTEAFRWYELSSAQNDSHGRRNAARCLRTGLGTARDLEKAKLL